MSLVIVGFRLPLTTLGAVSLIATMLMWLPLPAWSNTCVLKAQHVGLTFPVEKLDREWTCRLQPIIEDYTTANRIGPFRTAMSESIFQYLLDHPPTAAALINRLDLGIYKAETRGDGLYWGNDGEGTEGLVHLVYRDRESRIYYLEGTHHSTLLPNIMGKAVVLLRTTPVKGSGGTQAMDTIFVSYTRLNDRLLSGIVSMLRPIVGWTVTKKLGKGVEAVNRLGLEMRRDPGRVLREAADPPPLPEGDIVFLTRALTSLPAPSGMDSLGDSISR
ncbi:conserved exported protein of unknown function [Nitrospira sp. KM1]|uniref:hypothetical protein n=1 Tax=Nitrospira sp. KM1 TaxID=1936990 RepID=UPI0013A7B2A1|nr:hypothetical protein [Nitrospira sp. KM1]BCA53991.1 conserved exported protein of unknown function [Nitrospira sp. KM1]